MSKEKSLQGGLTRRSFLRASGLAAGSLGLAGAAGMTTADGWLSPTEAHAEPDERVAYLCHQFHCLGGCGIKCTVRDSRLVKVEPREMDDGKLERVCLRGISEVQHVYSADRLQTPLKRVGERGEGKFEAISWDEAIKTIADAIKESQEKYGDDSLYFKKTGEASSGQGFEFFSKLVHADTGGNAGLDRGQANGSDPSGMTTGGSAYSSIYEWPKASTIVHLGSNLFESAIVWSKSFFDAKDSGTKMITIDPRFSPTASKSHTWLPVKPGTDAALILGTIELVLEEKWYDEEYMTANTSFPFLVDEKTGELLGKMEERTDEATKKTTEVKIPMVWDTSTSSARYCNEEGVVPALEGSWKIDGVQAITEFDLLKKQMKEYTLEWTADKTGLEQEAIRDFADQYANGGPAIISYGFGGPDKYTNSDVLGHATAVLVSITGNCGRPGTGVGFYGAGGALHSGKLKAWTLPEEFVVSKSPVPLYDMPYKDNNIHVALTFGDAFTLRSADANTMLEWVKKLDFFAIVDIYHSSSVAYADIVLPACTKFECEEEVTHLRSSIDHVFLGQKCIDPLFESKTDLQIERLLAAQWGYEKYLPESYEDLARHMLSEVSDNLEGITFEALQKNNGAMRVKGSETPIVAFTDQVYGTVTTKQELYYENMLAHGQAFPQYEDPNEAFDANPKKNDYPLVFMQGKSRFRIHAYYSSSAWLQEYYGPSVNISPEDAAERSIVDGEDVEVFNDRGSFVARALINRSIQKGTLFMAETTYSQYYKKGFLQNVTNAHRQERAYELKFGPQISFNDTLVEIKKA